MPESRRMATRGARILVTGGTSGYGRALAMEFAGRGAEVMVVGRDAERLASAQGAGLAAVRADLTVPADRRTVLEAVRDRFGGLDAVVHSAAVQTPIDLVTDTPQNARHLIEREIDADLIAPLAFTVEALPLLGQGQGGRVVFVTSTLAFAPKRSAPAYCAAKAGLTAFALSLRSQLRNDAPRLRSAVVTLPLVDTPMTEGRAQRTMPAPEAARRTVRALERGAEDIDIGVARVFRLLHRIVPRTAMRITRDS
ncbi:SDR family NAD(P)-dependent oxidoreductase [Nocardiopsis sp. YSL2]|uniref:SDR family NAD(P)-dependent oxidoreductase n=1 Tax=Nocardiopsis sp. YSL2 TaxID=2939492 RepID=UPI0026F4310F|nr:SDR family NAD(P)-dependent oxidoreductase [Nocardiopsis sp. YSL2]